MKPLDSVKSLRECGKPVVGCFPPYPPLELLHSMGLTPFVLWGLRGEVADAERHIQNYACSVARRLAQFVMSDANGLLDGLLFYNACDTLRNLPEILREGLAESGAVAPPMFRIHVPMVPTEQTDSSGYLRNEFESLIGSLEAHFGVRFSEEKFAASVALYTNMRDLCLQLEEDVSQGTMTFTDFSENLMSANFLPVENQVELLESKIAGSGPSLDSESPRGRVIASGILAPPNSISRLIDDAGFRVVGNDIAALHRSYAYAPETWSDVYDYYAHVYGNHFPCTTLLYTADKRVEQIMKMVSGRRADGFLFVGEKFCEYEYLELPYLEKQLKELGTSVLAIEISIGDDTAVETYRTRIEAWAEMLEAAQATTSPRVGQGGK